MNLNLPHEISWQQNVFKLMKLRNYLWDFNLLQWFVTALQLVLYIFVT